jgi:outer membrane protein assembly factor BamB
MRGWTRGGIARVVAVLALAATGTVAGAAAGATAGTTTTTTKTTPPTITSFSPARGGVGTTVVLRGFGTGLLDATAVSFNGVNAASFTPGTEFLYAVVPAGATTGPISVTTPEGSATSATSFVVTTSESDVASAYQIGIDHSGVQSDAALAPPYTRRWVATLDGTPSYPLIAAGKVFVTTWSGTPNTGTTLWSLDQATGSVVWSKAIPGYYGFSAAAYDSGLVFFLNAGGTLAAFDAATGAQEWSGQLLTSSFTSPPTAANGVVYVSGSGWLYAIDELTGGQIAFESVEYGDHSSPAVSGGSVFVSYACNQAYAFGATVLNPLWHYSTFCSGGGGKTVVSVGGRAYTRDFNGNLILDAATGNLIGPFTPANTTALAPAVDHSSLYVVTAPFNTSPFTLSAQNLADGTTRWSFVGDGRLDTAPIVLATSSTAYVIEGSSSGMLFALDAATGAQVWSANVGAPISAPDEQNAFPLSGLGAGQALLIVPAGNTVSAYVHGSAPTVTSFSPASGPVGTTVTITGTDLSGATAVSVNGIAMSSFTVNSDTQITAVVGAGTTTGPISVTTADGTGTSSGNFTLIPAPIVSSFTPASGPVGTTVTITGTHLSGSTTVSVNGAAVSSFTVVSDTQIAAVIAAGTTSGPISVTTPGGTATSSSNFAVTVPDFSISGSPGTRTVAVGKSTTYVVTVTPSGGFNGSVALSLTGLPSGATASFSPSSTKGVSTLTVQIAHNAKLTTSTLTIRGDSGILSHTTSVVLQISKK